MKSSFFAFIAGGIVWSSMAFAASSPSCTTTREFITALEFLRQDASLKIFEKEARKIATSVSAGCTGGAERFIRIARSLSLAGLSGNDTVKTALSFSSRSDRETETFLAVFQRAFAQDGLDMDLLASMRLANSLSVEFEGDILAVRDDFMTLVDYCVDSEKLGLPRARCGFFAADLARQGQNYSGGIAAPFIEAVEFLRSESGPALTSHQAIEVATRLVEHGPSAPENFVQGYRYALAKKGLDVSRNEALSFAQVMALQTPNQSTASATAPTTPQRHPESGGPRVINRKIGSISKSK